jgi:hypothetical protein
MTVELQLADRSRYDGEIATCRDEVRGESSEKSGEYGGLPMNGRNGEQANFHGLAMRWQPAIEIRDLLVEGERTLTAPAHHADHLLFREADDVRVLVVEPVHQPTRVIRTVLRNLSREHVVIEPMDRLELRRPGNLVEQPHAGRQLSGRMRGRNHRASSRQVRNVAAASRLESPACPCVVFSAS